MPSWIRRTLRNSLLAVAVVLTLPLWSWTWCWKRLLGDDHAFRFCSELLSLFPGRPGIYLRRGYYWLTLDGFAPDCQIAFGTLFSHSQVTIGRQVVIGRHCSIGRVILEDGVALGSNVDLLSGRHQHIITQPGQPVQYQSGVFRQLRVGTNAWIGNNSVIMDDIGQSAVIGAGSVVVHAIPPDCVAVGNPARVKKHLTHVERPHARLADSPRRTAAVGTAIGE